MIIIKICHNLNLNRFNHTHFNSDLGRSRLHTDTPTTSSSLLTVGTNHSSDNISQNSWSANDDQQRTKVSVIAY